MRNNPNQNNIGSLKVVDRERFPHDDVDVLPATSATNNVRANTRFPAASSSARTPETVTVPEGEQKVATVNTQIEHRTYDYRTLLIAREHATSSTSPSQPFTPDNSAFVRSSMYRNSQTIKSTTSASREEVKKRQRRRGGIRKGGDDSMIDSGRSDRQQFASGSRDGNGQRITKPEQSTQPPSASSTSATVYKTHRTPLQLLKPSAESQAKGPPTDGSIGFTRPRLKFVIDLVRLKKDIAGIAKIERSIVSHYDGLHAAPAVDPGLLTAAKAFVGEHVPVCFVDQIQKTQLSVRGSRKIICIYLFSLKP